MKRLRLLWKIAGGVVLLYLLWAFWPARIPDAAADFRGYVRGVHARRVYLNIGNIVVVQGRSGGTEYGKYIVPLASSHLPFGGEFILGPATAHIEGDSGKGGAVVYDYRKGQQRCSELEPAGSPRHKSNVRGGWRRSLTYALGVTGWVM